MKHTLAVRRSDIYMLPVRTFGFSENACTTGRWAFGCSDSDCDIPGMKNRVPWKRIHPVGPLD